MPEPRPRQPGRRHPLSCLLVALAAAALLLPGTFALAGDEAKRPAAPKQPKQRQQNQAGNSFLWKIEAEGGNTVYLLGSIHVARQEFYPLAPEIEQAFEDSKVLAVEVDVQKVDAGAVQKLMFTKGMYQDGKSLADEVSPDTLKAFRAHCEKTGLPAAGLEKFRPWAVAITLAMIELQKLGYQPALGIDHHFLTKAHESNTPVVELETAESQIELLSGFGKEMEDKFLLQTLVGLDELAKTMETAAAAWKAGDVERLQEELLEKPLREAPEVKPVMVKMFDERNVKMAEKIDGFLNGDEPHFVVVGAGHMVGDKGLVKLLEDKGYKVEQVRVTPAAKKPAKR